MNCCGENAKMGMPACDRPPEADSDEADGPPATVPRYRGIGPEAYLNGTSQQEPTPEDARMTILMVMVNYSEISRLGDERLDVSP